MIDALYSGDLEVVEQCINEGHINTVDEHGDSLRFSGNRLAIGLDALKNTLFFL
jgi:hypothetical protein